MTVYFIINFNGDCYEVRQFVLFPSAKVVILGRIQDLTKGGSDKRPPKAVAPRGVRGHAPPENF